VSREEGGNKETAFRGSTRLGKDLPALKKLKRDERPEEKDSGGALSQYEPVTVGKSLYCSLKQCD